MTRRTARFTQAELDRAIKAATKAGLRVVGIRPDGTVLTSSQEDPAPEWAAPAAPLAPKRVIRLLA